MLQVNSKWRARYSRYGKKPFVALGLLMALTGMALILAGMQPRAFSGGGTGPSKNELKAGALQKARKPAKQRNSITSGCPTLRVPKVRLGLLLLPF